MAAVEAAGRFQDKPIDVLSDAEETTDGLRTQVGADAHREMQHAPAVMWGKWRCGAEALALAHPPAALRTQSPRDRFCLRASIWRRCRSASARCGLRTGKEHDPPPCSAFEPQVCAHLPASAHCGAGQCLGCCIPSLFMRFQPARPLFSPALRSSTWLRRRGEAGCRATAPSCLRCAWPRPAPRWRAATRCGGGLVGGGGELERGTVRGRGGQGREVRNGA